MPVYNRFKKKVSKTSSSLCPRAILLQPSLIAILFRIPLLKLAQSEQGFFSFLISKTISFISDFSSINFILLSSHNFFKKLLSKNSKPGLTLHAIISNFLG